MTMLSQVVKQLQSERAVLQSELTRLDAALRALGSPSGPNRRTSAGPRRKMSAAAKKRIAAAQKARWAAWRAKQKQAA